MDTNGILAAKAARVEAAAKDPSTYFSVFEWCSEIGMIRAIDRAYRKNGTVAGYVVFFYNGAVLNTDICYLYSRHEDIELSNEAAKLIDDGLLSECEFNPYMIKFFMY